VYNIIIVKGGNNMKNLDYISLKVVKEKVVNIESLTVNSPKKVVSFLQNEIGDRDREYLVALFLSTKNTIQAIQNISIGSLSASISHPREVFKYAVLKNSAFIILAHNHPSGNPNPSNDDIAVTERMVEAGQILGIKVIDHIIVSEDNYYSFKEDGLI